MTTTHWGASPDDWTMLSVVAGLTEDLLPVVSNPGARIDPDSHLKSLGKVPSLYNGSGMVVGLAKWTTKRSTLRDIDRWSTEPDLGICVQTRTVRALDVDIDDETVVDQVLSVIDRHLGEMPLRRREGSAKCLVAFTLPGDMTKRILRTAHGAIEFLANGQQFIACGTHPKGQRYAWVEGTPDDFPVVSREVFEACWAELMAQFATEECIEFGEGRQLKEARRRVDVEDDLAEYLRAEGWVLSETRDGRLNVRCPFEHEHSGPSADDTGTQYLPKGVGGFEVGHFKCLHAHCSGRNDGEFIEAVGFMAAQFDVVEYEPESGEIEAPKFDRNLETGKILVTINNVMLALRAPAWLGVDIARDEFRDELMLTPHGKRAWRAFRDADYTRTRMVLNAKGIAVSLDLIKEAINLRGDENTFDSAILWLREEVPAWDGVHRIDAFYPAYYGTDDTPYHRAVGAYTWTALAARVLDPGHKVDMVPVLSSGEGCRKSESIAAMVPDRDFFVELDLTAKDDDMSRLMRGKLVAELGEMRGLRQREMGALKSFITRRFENWVPKYKEFAVAFPRRLLFIGTTNEREILSEQTGQRRWLPMAITRADTDAIERDRLQLWAEARERFLADGVAYETAEVLAREEYAKFEETHPWEEVVSGWLDQSADFENEVRNRDHDFTTEQVLAGALHISASAMDKRAKNQVGAVLRKLGFEPAQKRKSGKPRWVWVSRMSHDSNGVV